MRCFQLAAVHKLHKENLVQQVPAASKHLRLKLLNRVSVLIIAFSKAQAGSNRLIGRSILTRYRKGVTKMAVVTELIRTEADGSISFGNYELTEKTKKSDYESG